LLFFLSLHIALAYIEGWVWGEMWSNYVNSAGKCLLNFENASDECLEKLWPNKGPLIIRERAPILKEYCLGPFADSCP